MWNNTWTAAAQHDPISVLHIQELGMDKHLQIHSSAVLVSLFAFQCVSLYKDLFQAALN